jgi:Cu-Zn family superoxide dismutase
MPRPVATSLLSAAVLTLAVGCGGAGSEPDGSAGEATAAGAEQSGAGTEELTATLVDPGGTEVGTVTFTEVEGGMQVSADVTGLPPGFHGFHVHAIGRCAPDSASPSDPSMTGDFLSAGGHLGAGDADHGEHAGDLPTRYVTGSGTGSLTVVTQALNVADLTDNDGSAVLVHAGRDDYANIPERYAPAGPDEVTRSTGDAGGRIACGPVERSGQG